MRDEIGSKMATDDERRRVAAALRKANVYTLQGRGDDGSVTKWSVALMSELAEAVGLRDNNGIEVFDRLADLIEPGDMSHGCRDTVACDRDALLALADEMDKWALTCDHYDRRVSPLDVTRYARRIRKACGVVG